MTYHETTRVFDGIFELLERLRGANIPMGIITLKTTLEADLVLKTMHLSHFFEDSVFGDDSLDGYTPYGIKPNPEHPLWSLMKLGLYSMDGYEFLLKSICEGLLDIKVARTVFGGDAVLVGDAGSDICTAKAAGMVAFGAAWGGRDREALKCCGADRVFDDPGDILVELRL